MRLIRRSFLFFSTFVLLAVPSVSFFGLRWFEHEITFHPERVAVFDPRTMPAKAEEVWILTADNVRLNGWYLTSRTSTATILFFHGNAGNISNVSWLGMSLAARGFNVLLID